MRIDFSSWKLRLFAAILTVFVLIVFNLTQRPTKPVAEQEFELWLTSVEERLRKPTEFSQPLPQIVLQITSAGEDPVRWQYPEPEVSVVASKATPEPTATALAGEPTPKPTSEAEAAIELLSNAPTPTFGAAQVRERTLRLLQLVDEARILHLTQEGSPDEKTIRIEVVDGSRKFSSSFAESDLAGNVQAQLLLKLLQEYSGGSRES